MSRTKQLARRQMAWFRRDPRIRWFEAGRGRRAGGRRRRREPTWEARVTRALAFAKYQGTRERLRDGRGSRRRAPLGPSEVAALCDRRIGVGADGVIRVVRGDDGAARFFMDYANADGSRRRDVRQRDPMRGRARARARARRRRRARRGDARGREASRRCARRRGASVGDRRDGPAELHEGRDPDARSCVGDVPRPAVRDRART